MYIMKSKVKQKGKTPIICDILNGKLLKILFLCFTEHVQGMTTLACPGHDHTGMLSYNGPLGHIRESTPAQCWLGPGYGSVSDGWRVRVKSEGWRVTGGQ